MAKFFQDTQPRMVWNPAENKVAVTFQNGEFETDDPAIADLLVMAGYRHNGSLPNPKPKTQATASISASATSDASVTKPKRMVRKKK